MKKLLSIFTWIKNWLSSLKKKIINKMLSPEEHKIIARIFQGEKLEVKHGDSFRIVTEIKFEGKHPYVIINNGGKPVQLFFDLIKEFRFAQ